MASSAGSSGSTDIFLTRKFLYDKMNDSGQTKLEDQVLFLKKYLEKRTNCPKSKISDLHNKVSYFISDFKKRWSSSYRMKEIFLTKNALWLETSISFPNYAVSKQIGVGRPKISFNKSSERIKRMKTQDLRSERSTEELCYAAQMALRSSGRTEAAKLLKEVTNTSPKRATRYKTAFKKWKTNERIQLSPDEALSMFVEAQLTRHQYNIIRSKDRERFPSYKKIQQARKDCYPNRQYISVNDSLAEIKLQGLLDHTASRLMQAQHEVIESQRNLQQLFLITKWGFDGSSGHSEYKQKFASGSASDASIFLSSLVPLRLISGEPEGPTEQQIILWNNIRSSSTRYCRPIRFLFAHETADLARRERDYIENQISKLVPTSYEMGSQRIEIHHKLLFTMVDGKICNSLTDTKSTMRCFLCSLTSKDFNNIQKCIEAEICKSNLQFGMSTLHAWIRFFECLLSLAYRLPLKKWQIRGEENKTVVENAKKVIRDNFRSQLGLIVDKPKPGYGNSNDGNTARRFFENAEISSSITGVDLELIKRFRTILKTVASGYTINLALFKAFALETAHLFVNKYPWYSMPPTIHKVLIHGPVIIENALLPMGQLSEEAQEANNKMFKRYREGFSRKFSREQTNQDILNRLLLSSDPLITSMHQPIRRKLTLDADVIQLLEAPELNVSGTSSAEQESDSDDSSS